MQRRGEIGRIGQKRYGGIFYEEFLHELRGKRGIEVYREMSENDDIIGAIIFAIEMLIRQATWSVEPGGSSAKDAEAAEFVEGCLDDMQDTWTDTLSEILSFIVYGWSFHEIVYKRRMGRTKNPKTSSKYNDGLIGWRKLPIRAQETLYQWEYDDEDNLIGLTQSPPPNFGLYTIPMSKGLLFRTKSRKGNPEGRSVLRNAYRDWYFKKRIQEIEGIGIERDLTGLPVIYTPEGVNIWDAENPEMVALYNGLMEIVKNIRTDEREGIVLPAGYVFQLQASPGSKQIDTSRIIERYDQRIAMTVLADFIFLGHESVGSFALSSDKTELFAMAIGTYLDIICETINSQGIPSLIDVNGDHFNGITDYPKLVHGDVETDDVMKIATYVKELATSGALIPDPDLEAYLRKIAGLPEQMEGFEGDPLREALAHLNASEMGEEPTGSEGGTQEPSKTPEVTPEDSEMNEPGEKPKQVKAEKSARAGPGRRRGRKR